MDRISRRNPTRHLALTATTKQTTNVAPPALSVATAMSVSEEAKKLAIETRATSQQIVRPTNLGVGAPLALQFGLEPIEKAYDVDFDSFVRRFHSDVFAGVDHPMIFIEKEYSMRRLCDGKPGARTPNLDDIYYCAKGRGEVAHAMYPRHGALDGRWSVDVIEHEGEFEGGIRMGRLNEVLRLQGPNGKIFEFRKVSDAEAREIEDQIRFSRGVRAYAPEPLVRLSDGTELPTKLITPMYDPY